MKLCKYCGVENNDHATVCSSCGASEFKYKCSNCGSVFEEGNYCHRCGVKAGTKARKCTICGTNYYTNACHNCGYTNRSNQNSGNTTVTYDNTNAQSSKKRKTWLWALGWICIFPVPLTILTLRNQKISKGIKNGIVIVAWLVYLLIAINTDSSESITDIIELDPSIENSAVQESNVDE